MKIRQEAAGGPYSGINVYVGASLSASIAIGDIVDVEGKVDEYFDDTEIANATITPKGMTMEPTVSEITVLQATDEMYEGVLVRIPDANVANLNYDCSVDQDTCSDENLWEIDGASGSSGILIYDRTYSGSDWNEQKGTLPVTGVMMYRFNRRRLLPRVPTDFGAN